MPELSDEEIRMKAVELSFNACMTIAAAAIQKDGLRTIIKIEPFSNCKDIEVYIKTGKIPDPIILKRRNGECHL